MAAEYFAVVLVSFNSTLTKEELERQLVVALWEGMDETIVIPDGQSDGLRVIEYVNTIVVEGGI